MKDVFAARKVSRALELSVRLARTALGMADETSAKDDDAFRSLLLDRPAQILSHVAAIAAPQVSELAHEQLCVVMEDAAYDPAAAARESESGFFLDLHQLLVALRHELEAEHESNQRLLPTASFVIGVDGSRQAFMAFDVATRLCRQGRLAVLHVDEAQSGSLQLPLLSSDFVLDEYKAHCGRLALPANHVAVASAPSSRTATASVAAQLLHHARRAGADFLVVGSVGKGGPAVDQLGHVTRELLGLTGHEDDDGDGDNSSSYGPQLLVVPPAPVNATRQRQRVIVVAVGAAAAVGARCLNAALKLAREADVVRVVHFYAPPVVGVFDAAPFESYCEALPQPGAAVDVLPLTTRVTTAESLQDYVAAHNAAFLVIGRRGSQQQQEQQVEKKSDGLGRVAAALLFSPRCAICACW